MTKPKTIDQLRAEKERAETQLAQEQHSGFQIGADYGGNVGSSGSGKSFC